MPVCALLYAANPTAEPIGLHPSSSVGRLSQLEPSPSMAAFRMLQNTAEQAHGMKRCCEASTVPAEHQSRALRRRSSPIAPPPFARWMRDNRPRTIVQPGIALLVPRIDAIQAEVAAASFDEERGYHPTLRHAKGGGALRE